MSVVRSVGAEESAAPAAVVATDALQVLRPKLGLRPSLVEASSYLRVIQARQLYNVDGQGLTCAIIDGGLRVTHDDFAGRVPVVRNFTEDDSGNPNIVTDTRGNGTHLAGIVAANGLHLGFAPKARIVPLKVVMNGGGGQTDWVVQALDWVRNNREAYNITCVLLSVGYANHGSNDNGYASDPIRLRIQSLRLARIPVIAPAGNGSFAFGRNQGMQFPALARETISVGAVFDDDVGEIAFSGGAIAFSTAAGRIAPFSQRLVGDLGGPCRTDIFSTGSPMTSSGVASNTASTTLHGTGQAAATVAGLVMLCQQLHLRRAGELPTVDQLEEDWLTQSADIMVDGDDEDDNIENTGYQFRRTDALNLLEKVNGEPIPVSNVVSEYSQGRLRLTGDDQNNRLTLNYSRSMVTVVPGTGTTLDGGTISKSFTLGRREKHRLEFVGNAGNDSIIVNSGALEDASFQCGTGDDSLTLRYCKLKSITADGGQGGDTLTLTGTRLPKRNSNINSFP